MGRRAARPLVLRSANTQEVSKYNTHSRGDEAYIEMHLCEDAHVYYSKNSFVRRCAASIFGGQAT